MFFQKDVETMKRKDIEALQLEKLRHMVDYCYRNVPFYTKKLDEAHVTADKIKSLSDIKYIPPTTKATSWNRHRQLSVIRRYTWHTTEYSK
jgi:phenylacetate-CoA ligase